MSPESSQTTRSAQSALGGPSRVPLKPYAKVKIVACGDGGVGKTCMLISYAENRFPTTYTPTVFENYVTTVPFGDKQIEISLWDTAGQEEYDRLRPLSYPESDMILICFAVDYPTSLANVEDKWYPEVSHFCDGVPILLIGTKVDLRTDQRTLDLLSAQGTHPITAEEGRIVARRMGAGYHECSAKGGQGIQEIFAAALAGSMKSRGGVKAVVGKRMKGKCLVL